MLDKTITPCEICGDNDWTLLYQGPVLDGRTKGGVRTSARFCKGCGVIRLDDSMDAHDYATDRYRNKLKEPINAEGFYETHDHEQIYKLLRINDIKIRGKKVLDIGAAAGSFIDYVRGVAGQVTAVEPCRHYERELFAKCWETYPYLQNIVLGKREYDLITCFDTLEHVQAPQDMLAYAYQLLAPGGTLVASTGVHFPLQTNDKPELYFRTQHKWYWTEESFGNLAKEALAGHLLQGTEIILSTNYEPHGLQMYLRVIKPTTPVNE